jgi:hypothetical protein
MEERPEVVGAALSPSRTLTLIRRVARPIWLRVGLAAILEIPDRHSGMPVHVTLIPWQVDGSCYLSCRNTGSRAGFATFEREAEASSATRVAARHSTRSRSRATSATVSSQRSAPGHRSRSVGTSSGAPPQPTIQPSSWSRSGSPCATAAVTAIRPPLTLIRRRRRVRRPDTRTGHRRGGIQGVAIGPIGSGPSRSSGERSRERALRCRFQDRPASAFRLPDAMGRSAPGMAYRREPPRRPALPPRCRSLLRPSATAPGNEAERAATPWPQRAEHARIAAEVRPGRPRAAPEEGQGVATRIRPSGCGRYRPHTGRRPRRSSACWLGRSADSRACWPVRTPPHL